MHYVFIYVCMDVLYAYAQHVRMHVCIHGRNFQAYSLRISQIYEAELRPDKHIVWRPIFPSRITPIPQRERRELTASLKRARIPAATPIAAIEGQAIGRGREGRHKKNFRLPRKRQSRHAASTGMIPGHSSLHECTNAQSHTR